MADYPLILNPILKPRVWGGRRLADLGKALPPDEPIGESWEVADLPDTIDDGRSRIANGPLAGQTLGQVLAEHMESILGATAPTPGSGGGGGFPLLIKYLDARENLSVQVHPTAAYVRTHPEAHLKSEAWVVVAAEPGAVIYKGLKPHVTPASFAANLEAGTAVDDLIALPAVPGECHYLPAGTCHALGAGILLAEIQTPSDTTFRVYDWGRTGRELHVERALACITFGEDPAHKPDRPVNQVDGLRTMQLLETDDFTIERVEILDDRKVSVVTDNMPMIWMMLHGSGMVTGGGESVSLTPGVTTVLPAALDRTARTSFAGGTEFLQITLPDPTRRMLA